LSIGLKILRVSERDLARLRQHGLDPAELLVMGGSPDEDFSTWELEQQERIFREREAANLVNPADAVFRQAKARVARRLAVRRGQAAELEAMPLLDLGAAWQAIDTLLNGRLLAGGAELGGDLGYGPARGIWPDDTRLLAEYAVALDPCAPGPLDGQARREIAYLWPRLRDYLDNAVASGCGLLIWLY
jgi:hypothetical protein